VSTCNYTLKPGQFLKYIQRIEGIVLLIFGILATLVMFGNVVARYVFHNSFVWAEEVIRILFVWSMFIAITTGFIRNQHIGFSLLADKHPLLQFISQVLYKATLAFVGVILAFYGAQYNVMVGSAPLSGTNWPTSLFLIPGIIAGAAWFFIGSIGLVALVVKAVQKHSGNDTHPGEKH